MILSKTSFFHLDNRDNDSAYSIATVRINADGTCTITGLGPNQHPVGAVAIILNNRRGRKTNKGSGCW